MNINLRYKPLMHGVFLIAFTCLLSLTSPSLISAKVTGPCANCHTMHNSQNGAAVVRDGAGIGWNGSGQLAGGSLQGPQNTLLVTSCVGCHSSTTNSTIISIGGSRIPIVYNTVAPTNPLAGGNFYWVAQGGAANDPKGHNVYGIAAQDNNLATAPGKTTGACASSCHISLVLAPNPTYQDKTGCQGCHVFTSHHTDRGWYRSLKGHTSTPTFDNSVIGGTDYVTGSPDADWEQTTNTTKHNYYKGTTVAYSSGSGLEDNQTITSFCQGCHGIFHGPQSGTKGMGSSSPWIRHPTDIALPSSGEYSAYNPVTNYSVEAPVAWTNPNPAGPTGPIVMCLSCHRAHGSPNNSILRWDYSTMVAGGGGTGGCFTCHTTKN